MLICVSGVGSSGAKALDPGRKDVRKLLTEVHTQNEKKTRGKKLAEQQSVLHVPLAEQRRWGKNVPETRIRGASLMCYFSCYLVDPASGICLSQRLSHASASMSEFIQRNCEWLGKTAIISSEVNTTRITVVILELIRTSQ